MRHNHIVFYPALIVILLFGCSLQTRAAGNGNAKEKADATIESAISAVYPALVQIYTVTIEYAAGQERKVQTAGSGVIITPEGHVITNYHVVGKAAMIKCALSSREEVDAQLVGADPLGDIAVIKLDLSSRIAGAQPLSFARFGDSDELKVGDAILAMGCPMALSQSVTRGIVSNKDMTIPRMLDAKMELEGEDVGSLVKWIGHDAQIFNGNSGGPLVNMRGEIVGINEMGLGLGGAIPSNIAKAISQELMEHGRVRRAWIGAEFQTLLKSTLNKEIQGVLVSGVIPDSPAERAGLRPGDVVLSVDGDSVSVRFPQELPGFTRLLLSKPIGKPVEFKIARGNERMTLTVQTELRDDAKGNDLEAKEWGLTARRLSVIEAKELTRKDQKGVLINSVRPGGPAEQAQPGLMARDVITDIGGKPVNDLDSFVKITAEMTREKTEPVPVLVAFDRKGERELTIVDVGIVKPQEPPAELEKAWLPVATQVLSRKLAEALNLTGVMGVRITQVYPGSTAEEADFRVGDVITHVDGRPIQASESHNAHVFESMLRAYKPGAKPEFDVIRDGQKIKITSTLVVVPKTENQLKVYEDSMLEFKARDIAYLDALKRRWKKDEKGVLVTETDPGGWASVGGLFPDDLILAVDGRAVLNVDDLEQTLEAVQQKKPKQINFLVRRGIHTLFVELEPKWPGKK